MLPNQLTDHHTRIINYMRLAVTDRCNLRCFYCMPEEGISFLERKEIMSYEEMYRLIQLLQPLGVDKIRITGGEPFVRKDIMYFLKKVKKNIPLSSFSMTTNATLIQPFIADIPQLFDSINVSLDSLDAHRFFQITRRDAFDSVIQNIEALLERGVHVKINTVVMPQHNVEDILPLVAWTKDKNISVRFIEEMPFNATRDRSHLSDWDYQKILKHIQKEYPNIITVPQEKSATATMYQVKGFKGCFGVIPAYSRTFCTQCNRIRMTAKGVLRTCLYSDGGVNLLSLMRNNATDEAIQQTIINTVKGKEKDGFEAAEKRNNFISIYESMTTIGG